MSLSQTESNVLARNLPAQPPLGFWHRQARAAVLKRLSRLSYGSLEVVEDQKVLHFGASAAVGSRSSELSARIEVRNPKFWQRLATGGAVGAGEAFMEGWWTSTDLVSVIRLFARNLPASDAMDSGFARLRRPIQRLRHRLRSNSKVGSKRNIYAHYDLGNAFFSLWLDPTLSYSSAVFESSDASLEEASIAKIDRLCRKLSLQREDHLLEIGTGWGAFALHAAQEYGCRVTTTTISNEQYAVAQQRIEEAGLSDRVTLLNNDYRDLEGQFDKLVSVEMIEAVGHQHHRSFFQACARLLKPEGRMALQAITLSDQRYERALTAPDFIQRYIFPGSCLTSPTRICEVATRYTDLRLTHLEDITAHYAKTLAAWRERFLAVREQVRGQGFPESFLRMWEYYLAYCEGGFEERHIGTIQVVMDKAGCRAEAPLPARDAFLANLLENTLVP